MALPILTIATQMATAGTKKMEGALQREVLKGLKEEPTLAAKLEQDFELHTRIYIYLLHTYSPISFYSDKAVLITLCVAIFSYHVQHCSVMEKLQESYQCLLHDLIAGWMKGLQPETDFHFGK